MASRVVSVALRAEIGQYVASMAKAAGSTAALGSSVDNAAGKANRGLGGIGTAGMVAGGLVAAGLGMAVSKSMEFEASMSAVAAASGQTGAALSDLREEAMRAGAATQYSATEAADAITEMSKAGVSAADIMGGGLDGALSLAAAGQLAVADAAEIASVAMTQFNLAGEDLPHVADLLAAGAGKAMGSVDDLGQALNQAGLVASAAGLDIEETTGGLAAFASAGLVGSDAGTSFKTMLQALQAPTGKSAELMEQLGLDMYDSQGNMLGLADMAGQLQNRLGGLTEEQRNAALAQIFGSDAVRAANVLYREGSDGIEDWTRKVNDQGYAAEQAAALNDNLRGDLERLGGAFDTLLISIGSGAQGPLRELTQGLTGILDVAGGVIEFFTNLSTPVQIGIAAMGTWAVAGGQITSMLGPLRSSTSGFFDTFNEAAGYARQNGDGLTTVFRSMGDVAGDAAKNGFKSLARAIGPELGFALAAMAAVGLYEAIRDVNEASEQASTSIEGLLEPVANASNSADRIAAQSAAIQGLREQAEAAQEELEAYENRSTLEKIWNFGDIDDPAEDLERAVQLTTDALDEQQRAADRATETTGVLSRQFNISEEDVRSFADEAGINLSGSLGLVQSLMAGVIEEAGHTATGLDGASTSAMTGFENFSSYASALGLSEEATEELRKRTEELGQSFSSFVDPLGAYTGLIDAKKEAERQSAQATADATADQSDSWEDYVTDVSVSFDEYVAQLQEQVTAQAEWRTNMLLLASRVSAGTLEQLQLMGPAGADLVADLVTRSAGELAQLEPLMAQSTADAGTAMADELLRAQPVLSQIAATAGQGVADSLTAQLAAGTITVAQIAAQYGIVLAEGVNPVLASLGRTAIIVAAPRAAPGTAGRHADGGAIFGPGTGTSDSIPAMLSNGEYVIRASSVDKYGVDVLDNINQGRAAFAAGGFVSADSVPKPRSTAPFGPPLSSGADASMGASYDAVVKFLSENALADAGFVGSGKASPNGVKGLGPRAAAARAYVMEAFGISNIGGYANRNIAGTGTVSDHALGKAIDVMIGNYKSQAGIAQGNSVASYFINNPDAYGTKYVIWRDQINQGGGWKPYGHPGGGRSDTLQHRDHVHVSFYNQGGLVDGMPQYKQGTPFVPNDGPAYLHKGEQVIPAYANGGMVQWGQVSEDAWNGYLAAGWKGRQGDGMEALYAPASREVSGGSSSSSSTSSSAGPDGPLRIEGKVLVNGLEGMISGQVMGGMQELNRILTGRGVR